jgi:tRNA(Arg) A34 adenosine deaminase TadA
LDPDAFLPAGEAEVNGEAEVRGARREFMQRAIAAAVEGMRAGEGGPFGALVARGDEVLAVACNRVLARNDPTAHAEVEAIRAACAKLATFRLEGCDLYATCEPCPMCLAAAYWARVDRVIHACNRDDAAAAGFADAEIHREMRSPSGERRLPLVPFEREAGLAVFREWLEQPDRTLY